LNSAFHFARLNWEIRAAENVTNVNDTMCVTGSIRQELQSAEHDESIRVAMTGMQEYPWAPPYRLEAQALPESNGPLVRGNNEIERHRAEASIASSQLRMIAHLSTLVRVARKPSSHRGKLGFGNVSSAPTDAA
jgi:hypothetical protein